MTMKSNNLCRAICAVIFVTMLHGFLPAYTKVQAQSISPIHSIRWSPDGSKLATGHEDGTIRIWNAGNGTVLHVIQAFPDRVTMLNWKSDGSQIISGGFDPNAYVWDVNTGLALATLPAISPDSLLAASWTLDNQQIVTWGFDTNPNFYIWDAETFDLILSDDRGGDVIKLAWSPDETKVAMANAAGGTGIANPVTFEITQYLREPETPSGGRFGVYSVAWSPDGSKVVSGNTAGVVRIWNANTGENLLNLQATDSPTIDWNVSAVRVLFFNGTGNHFTSLTADGTLRTWEISTGNILQTTQLGNAPIFAADVSSDGTKIAYGGQNGTVQIAPTPNSTTCNPSQTVAAGDVTGFINAINAANANTDASVIGVSGTYTFTAVNNGLNALPKITTDITICSQNGATLARQAGSPAFRFFDIQATGTLTLENLTLTGADSGSEPGGAIINTGNLTVNNVTFTGNHAGTGAAIDNHRFGGTSNPITATISNSTFQNNTATYGAALDNDANATMTVTNSTFTGNVAVHDGGVIDNDSAVTFTDSTFTSNSAGRYGGAVETNGNLTLNGGTFFNNTAAQGGAVRNTSALTVTGTTFQNNTSATGGGYEGWGGAIFNISTGNGTVTGAVFSQNTAVNGGAIRNHGVLSLTDSQILNNTASAGGSGIFSTGSTTAHNSCISGNTASVTSVVHVGSNVQDFAGNYWGATDGPSGSGTGSGDSVNHNINYANFLTAGCPILSQ